MNRDLIIDYMLDESVRTFLEDKRSTKKSKINTHVTRQHTAFSEHLWLIIVINAKS